MATYFAHSENDLGNWDPLRVHLTSVADRARRFAEVFGAGDDAWLAGILHDLGKYGDLFQDRLRGKERGLDHWSLGASACLVRYKNDKAALAIQGHHLGLQSWEKEELRRLLPAELEKHMPAGRRLTERDCGILLDRLATDGVALPKTVSSAGSEAKCAASMLDLRMLFSALVDADYLATEAHFGPHVTRIREPIAELRPAEAAEVLDRHLEALAARVDSSSAVAAVRRDLLGACRAAAKMAPGLFTLTAPTGAGKTLSTLAFALRHASQNALRRIVVVMPFLSIIDQTVRVYREVLAGLDNGGMAERYLIEHHSLAAEADEGRIESRSLRGLLAQNWDAPIIITTSVQFLESLFSNSPAACRKLHRLAKSVIVFDEVQTIPLKVVLPTLATLSHLAARYGSSVVFSTATQPAFRHLDSQVRQFCANGWSPREIVPDELRLFERSRRVRVEWPLRGEHVCWEHLARQLTALSQVLCIVNLKRHARDLFDLLQEHWGGAVFHLSTAMCPAHRAAVLGEVRARLENGSRCALVATQCVEAGVDLDFPAAFRALGPLDSIAQAAGRCNRNGRLKNGVLHVFSPKDSGCPPGVYKQATELTAALLSGANGPCIDDPAVFDAYFRNLYSVAKLEDRDLRDAIQARDFRLARKHYRIIDEDTVNVLVAYDPERYWELAAEAREQGLSRDWVIRARPHTVSCFRVAAANLETVPLRNRAASGDWYLCDQHYNARTGLRLPKELDFMQA